MILLPISKTKMVEIERKFLVKNTDFIAQAHRKTHIIQGYLNSDKERTVRVRIKDDKGFLTIKGLGNASGTTRFEWEKEIPLVEANQLLNLCEPFPIEKMRYEVIYKDFLYEIDIFQGKFQGLILAEIELDSEEQFFEKPEWLGKEVTGDKRFYNSYLSKNQSDITAFWV